MEMEVVQFMALFIMMISSQMDSVVGLRCWQCIADNCYLDPSENYKATQKECLPGSYCQKVIYSDRFNNTTNPISIVRSCSSRCTDKDNSHNCTLSKRGCVTRHCCQDSDFCNGGARFESTWQFFLGSILTPYWLVQYARTFAHG
ncbi:uncharacterized protein LOC135478014 [Liolophura sinensis]|uniref:uncharacterized protein LOC135478014 n=1 Tax=Liolophura sinensis TaxID=3198878 RepID=UPI0031594351